MEDELRGVISRATTRKAPPQPRQSREQLRKAEKTEEELEAERRQKEEEEKEEAELEKACEQWCSRVCRVLIVVPLVFSYVLHPTVEYFLRPNLALDPNLDVFGTYAVVTGGCSGVGLQTSIALARGGAVVTLGCRDPKTEDALRALRLVKEAASKYTERHRSKPLTPPQVLPLRLDSLASVRSFASKYNERIGRLNLLINNAGTRQACELTEDGMEVAFQVNYLAPFLLTNLFLPLLQDSGSARVVNVLCRDGYLRPAHGWNLWFKDGWLKGWLGMPVPIKEGIRLGPFRVEAPAEGFAAGQQEDGVGHEFVMDDELEIEEDEEEDTQATPNRDLQETSRTGRGAPSDWTTGCRPEKAYANAKLALLAFSHELERRLRDDPNSEAVVSHAVNPNAVASDFLAKGSPASSNQGWGYYKVMSYLPPVWVSRKVFGFLHSVVINSMLRSVEHGAAAVVHVATAEALAGAGGGLFDDTESAFVDCKRPASSCGKVPRLWQPPVVADSRAGKRLWSFSEELLKDRHSR